MTDTLERAPAPVIHILEGGKAMCLFHKTAPKLWPKGHAWIGRESAEVATCGECKARDAEEKIEARFRPSARK